MKKAVSILAMFFIIAVAASAQSIEKLFDKYQDDERFQYIYQKKTGKFEVFEDIFEVANDRIEMNDNGKKMLVLSGDDESFADQFTKEIQNAIRSDKYENTSLVRTGKNRVEKYSQKTEKGNVNKISFIRNPGNITLIWYSYVPK